MDGCEYRRQPTSRPFPLKSGPHQQQCRSNVRLCCQKCLKTATMSNEFCVEISSFRQIRTLLRHWACSEIRSRVLRSATVPFFYHKTNGTVALRSTLERISEHAHCCPKRQHRRSNRQLFSTMLLRHCC